MPKNFFILLQHAKLRHQIELILPTTQYACTAVALEECISVSSQLTSQEFDLCILDPAAVALYVHELTALRAMAGSSLIPLLLLTTRDEVNTLAPQVHKLVDAVICTPLTRAYISSKIDSLLADRRTRNAADRPGETAGSDQAQAGARWEQECIKILDVSGNILHMNPTGLTLIEAGTLDAIRGMSVYDFIVPEYRTAFRELIVRVFSGENRNLEFEVVGLKGTRRWLEMHAVPLRNSLGEIVSCLGVTREVTRHKLTEATLRDSQSRYEQFVHTIDGIVWESDVRTNHFTFVSKQAERLLGYPVSCWLEDRDFWVKHVHPDDRAWAMEYSADLTRQKIDRHSEYRMVSADGRIVWLRDSITVVLENDEPVTLRGVMIDITEAKQAAILEDAVYRIAQAADSTANLNELFRSMHEIIGSVMPARNFYLALYDRDEDLLTFPYFVDEADTPPPPGKPRRGLTEYVLRTGASLLCDATADLELQRQGEIEVLGMPAPIWLGVPLIIGKKTIGVMVVQHYSDAAAYGRREQQILEYVSSQVARAIERKRTDDVLRESEERYRVIAEQTGQVLYDYDVLNGQINWSGAIEHITGFSPGEYQKVDITVWEEFIHPADRAFAVELLAVAQTDGIPYNVEYRFRRKDGVYIYIEDNGVFVKNAKGVPERMLGTMSDITARKKADEELRESEERYRSLIESARDAIFTISPQGIFTSLNRAFEVMTGWDRAAWVGKSFSDIFHPDDAPLAMQVFTGVLQGLTPPVHEYRLRTAAGTYIIGEFTTTPQIRNGQLIGLLGIARNVTERKKLEEQLRQSQKMESIGTLAGGIAHDFNNILAIIIGHSSTLAHVKNDQARFTQSVEAIGKAVHRGAAMVRQLLTFARKTESIFEPADLNLIAGELVKLLEETFPRTITFTTIFKCTLPSIIGDHNQIHQALLNLCVNARDAMPNGGRLAIETLTIDGPTLQRRFPNAVGDSYACITVSDTGEGMSEETRARIFEPFFTTKERGKGTGLGLAVVFGVMQNHHGIIDVESIPNEGTSIHLYFPFAAKDMPADTATIKVAESNAGGTETLLVVEDEEMILDLLVSSLEGKGYTVMTATNGEDAVEIFKQHHARIDLVLSDLGLPKLGGWEAFSQMREIKPELKGILASGYIPPQVRTKMMQSGSTTIVQKPYAPNDVTKLIRQVIDGKKAEE